MAQFVQVPIRQLAADTLQALLEEYATRDGTDYGDRERSLEEKTAALQRQLGAGDLALVFDLDSEQYDLIKRDALEALNLD